MAKQTRTTESAALPLMVVAGDEVFLRDEHLREIQHAVLGAGDPGMALVRFDETADMATVLDEVRTPSMFSSQKMVIVDPADALLKAKAEDEEPVKGKRPALTPREMLENYLESPPENAVLVLAVASWLKNTRLHKRLDPRGGVRWALAIKPFQVPAWLTRRARDAHGKQVEPLAAQRLAELIGPDLQRLDNELAKLSLYEPQNPAITPAAVDALVGFQHEQQIWDMINALAARDARTALKKIDELWQLDPKMDYTAVGAVTNWLGQVLKARELIDRRLGDGQIIAELRLWPQDRAQHVLNLARQWGLRGAARWSEALLRVDIRNKSSVGDVRSNLEKFIVALCA